MTKKDIIYISVVLLMGVLLGYAVFGKPDEPTIPSFYIEEIKKSKQRTIKLEKHIETVDRQILNMQIYLIDKYEEIDTADKSTYRDLFNDWDNRAD